MAEQDNRTQGHAAVAVVTHPLDSDDAPVVAAMRTMVSSSKGLARGIEGRTEEAHDGRVSLDRGDSTLSRDQASGRFEASPNRLSTNAPRHRRCLPVAY